MVRLRRPSLPTSVLPKLGRSLSGELTTDRLLTLLAHLRLLYAAPPQDGAAHPDEETVQDWPYSREVEEDDGVDPLHAHDAFERTWAVNWLNLVVKRGEGWMAEADEVGDEGEKEVRARIVDEAAQLVSLMSATSGASSRFSSSLAAHLELTPVSRSQRAAPSFVHSSSQPASPTPARKPSPSSSRSTTASPRRSTRPRSASSRGARPSSSPA